MKTGTLTFKTWNGIEHSIEYQIKLEPIEVHFNVNGSTPLLNNFEDIASTVFAQELMLFKPTSIKWFYNVDTFTSYHTGEILLTPFEKDGKVCFTGFKAVNTKVVNK